MMNSASDEDGDGRSGGSMGATTTVGSHRQPQSTAERLSSTYSTHSGDRGRRSSGLPGRARRTREDEAASAVATNPRRPSGCMAWLTCGVCGCETRADGAWRRVADANPLVRTLSDAEQARFRVHLYINLVLLLVLYTALWIGVPMRFAQDAMGILVYCAILAAAPVLFLFVLSRYFLQFREHALAADSPLYAFTKQLFYMHGCVLLGAVYCFYLVWKKSTVWFGIDVPDDVARSVVEPAVAAALYITFAERLMTFITFVLTARETQGLAFGTVIRVILCCSPRRWQKTQGDDAGTKKVKGRKGGIRRMGDTSVIMGMVDTA
jgi:hypothetical protein